MGSDGIFRRRVAVTTRRHADGLLEARCAVEDDYHRFRVLVEARQGRVSAVRTDARRSPNSLCQAAGGRLQELVGMALDPASAAVFAQTDQFQQCTHQLDLAGLGVAALALERPRRHFEILVPDRVDGRTTAKLLVDGAERLVWQVDGMTVEGPEPYSGRSLGAGFSQFTRTLDRDEAEAALVMRRGLFVSQGRGVDFSALGHRGPVGGCWAWQPERMETLRRRPEDRRDFSQGGMVALAGETDWLAFAE